MISVEDSLSAKGRMRALRALLLSVAVVTIAVVLPGTAGANINTYSVNSVLSDPTAGVPSDIDITQTFTYSGVPSGGALVSGDDLRRWILDTPAGAFGNPNAVPYDSRCEKTMFALATLGASPNVCPDAARVGWAKLTLGVDANGATAAVLDGTIYALKNDGVNLDVPTELGTIFTSSGVVATTSRSTITPVANGDFRLRTLSDDNIARPAVTGPFLAHIKQIQLHIFGYLPNGTPFHWTPNRCENWDTVGYALAYGANSGTSTPTNGTDDPLGEGANNWLKATSPTTSPACRKAPFRPFATTRFSTHKRDTNPAVTFTLHNPYVPGDAVPKKVVTTLPAELTTDIQRLNDADICSVANRDAGTCQDSAKVGAVAVETPTIRQGLSGDVYITRSSNSTLPNLSVFVKGAINFRLDAVNTFGGPRGNQIISTFDNQPQIPFSKFTLTIFGGTNTLLTIPACPGGNKTPQDGPVTWDFTSWDGQTTSVTNETSFKECTGVELKKPSSCVKNTLKLAPTYASRSHVRRASLYVGREKVDTVTKGKFNFEVSVSDLQDGNKKATVRALYDSGKKAKDTVTFRKC